MAVGLLPDRAAYSDPHGQREACGVCPDGYDRGEGSTPSLGAAGQSALHASCLLESPAGPSASCPRDGSLVTPGIRFLLLL